MQIDNELNKGLNLDYNPITISSGYLTNCLNGTLKTNNGNEGILQNDMGNTKVGTAYLPAGYVPVGMKEYGGIVYVASKNPITGKCQLGSFPSPGLLLNAFLDDLESLENSEIKFSNFIEKNKITKVRQINRLSSKLNVGDLYKIKDENNNYLKLPYILKYNPNPNTDTGDKLDTSVDFLLISLGIKSDNNNIIKIDDVSDLTYNYIKDTAGELYLIQEVLIPEEFSVCYEITDDKQHAIFYFSKNDADYEGTGDDILVDLYGNNGKWEGSLYVLNINGDVHISFTPKLGGLLIPKLTQEIFFNIDDISNLITIKKANWKTQYDPSSKKVKISYGFTGGLNYKEIKFEFYKVISLEVLEEPYKLDKNSITKTHNHKSLNGYFTKTINDLEPNSLYLTKIICYAKQNTDTKIFYDWTWTVKDVLTVDNTYIYNAYIKVDPNISLNENIQGDDPVTTGDDGTSNNLCYKKVFRKTITVTNNIKYQYVNEENIPIKLPALNSDNFTTTTELKLKKNSQLLYDKSKFGSNTFDYYELGKLYNVYESNNATNSIVLEATYVFFAAKKNVSDEIVGYLIKPYAETFDDKNFIYGVHENNDFPKYGFAIGAGIINNTSWAEYVHTVIDFYSWNSSDKEIKTRVKEIYNESVLFSNVQDDRRSFEQCINKPLKDIWMNGVTADGSTFLKLNYYPPICFIHGSDNGRYNESKKRTSELYTNGPESILLNDRKNYSLILWKDLDDNYKLIKSGFTKDNVYSKLNELFANLYVANTVETTINSPNYNIINTQDYEYTTTNIVEAIVLANCSVELKEYNDLDISGYINALIPNGCTAPTVLFIVSLIEGNQSITESKILDALDISDVVYLYTKKKDENLTRRLCYFKENDNVITSDVEGNNLNNTTIYYKNGNNLIPLSNSDYLLGSDLPDACGLDDLTAFNNYLRVERIYLGNYSKNCIVLKSDSGRNTVPLNCTNDIYSKPCIGEISLDHPEDERHTYPFTLVGRDNYVHLCDLSLPGANIILY